MSEPEDSRDRREEELDSLAREEEPGLVAEFLAFLGDNKSWWILPILIVLLVLGALVVLVPSSAVPFIYTLF